MLRTAPEEDEEVTTSSLSLDSRWEREEELLDMECCCFSRAEPEEGLEHPQGSELPECRGTAAGRSWP